jgi:hypothetical protein
VRSPATARSASRLRLAGALAALALAAAPGTALGVLGDFSQPASSPEPLGGTVPQSLVAAHLNGDANLDLAVVNSTSDDVTVLLGDGTGDFSAAGSSPESLLPAGDSFDIAAGDLDGDEDVDLATANNDGTASVLLNDGSGDFTVLAGEAAGPTPRSIAIADMNGDTELDLVIGNFFGAFVTVLLNDGDNDGDFTALAAEDVGGNADNVFDVAAAQIDNDADVDVVVINEYLNKVRTMSNNGLGDLTTVGTPVATTNPISVALGQFGSNAFADLAVLNQANPSTVSVLIGFGDGTYSEAAGSPVAVPNSADAWDVAAGDLNSDGHQDLAVTGGTGATSKVTVLLGNGAGAFSPAATSPEATTPGSLPIAVALGNFNGGGLDMATANLHSHDVSVLLNDAATPPPPGGGGASVPSTTPPKKKCRKGQKLKKGKCVKKKRKKKK